MKHSGCYRGMYAVTTAGTVSQPTACHSLNSSNYSDAVALAMHPCRMTQTDPQKDTPHGYTIRPASNMFLVQCRIHTQPSQLLGPDYTSSSIYTDKHVLTHRHTCTPIHLHSGTIKACPITRDCNGKVRTAASTQGDNLCLINRM